MSVSEYDCPCLIVSDILDCRLGVISPGAHTLQNSQSFRFHYRSSASTTIVIIIQLSPGVHWTPRIYSKDLHENILKTIWLWSSKFEICSSWSHEYNHHHHFHCLVFIIIIRVPYFSFTLATWLPPYHFHSALDFVKPCSGYDHHHHDGGWQWFNSRWGWGWMP